MVHFSQSSHHFCSDLRIKWLSHLLAVRINSNQIQVVLLERAQAHNSQASANLTAGTACIYGWACARKVRIVILVKTAANKWFCMICCKTLLVRLPYYTSRHVLCAHGARQPRHSADALVPSSYRPIFSLCACSIMTALIWPQICRFKVASLKILLLLISAYPNLPNRFNEDSLLSPILAWKHDIPCTFRRETVCIGHQPWACADILYMVSCCVLSIQYCKHSHSTAMLMNDTCFYVF